jgi:hypothetical protein
VGQRYQDAKAASGKLALKLNTCRPDDATGKSLNCDYQVTFLGCMAKLRIDETDYGPSGLLQPDDIDVQLHGDCEPEALSAMFGSIGTAAELPVEISGLKLLVGDNIQLQGKLSARGVKNGGESVAATACAKELGNANIGFTIAVGGGATFKPDGAGALGKCAQAYTTGLFADNFLSPNLKQDIGELQKRIRLTAKEWFDSVAKAGFGKCDPANVHGWLNVTCTPITLADAQLKKDWKEVSAGWCKTIAGPIQPVLDAANVKANATAECQRALTFNCDPKAADPICSRVVGAKYGVEVTPPFAQAPVATAAASYTLPDVPTITSCFAGKTAIDQSAGYLALSLTPDCVPGGSTIKLTGSISLVGDFPWKVPPAPISLLYDLKTGKASADVNSPDWRVPLNEALSNAIEGQTLGIDGVAIRVDKGGSRWTTGIAPLSQALLFSIGSSASRRPASRSSSTSGTRRSTIRSLTRSTL